MQPGVIKKNHVLTSYDYNYYVCSKKFWRKVRFIQTLQDLSEHVQLDSDYISAPVAAMDKLIMSHRPSSLKYLPPSKDKEKSDAGTPTEKEDKQTGSDDGAPTEEAEPSGKGDEDEAKKAAEE